MISTSYFFFLSLLSSKRFKAFPQREYLAHPLFGCYFGSKTSLVIKTKYIIRPILRLVLEPIFLNIISFNPPDFSQILIQNLFIFLLILICRNNYKYWVFLFGLFLYKPNLVWNRMLFKIYLTFFKNNLDFTQRYLASFPNTKCFF